MASACSNVRADRLAMVRFLMRLPFSDALAQQNGRFGATIGHEVDIHAADIADLRRCGLIHADALHGYIKLPFQAYRIEMTGLSPFPSEARFKIISVRFSLFP